MGKTSSFRIAALCLMLLLSACSQSAAPTQVPAATNKPAETQPLPPQTPTQTLEQSPTVEKPADVKNALPPEPQIIKFKASDGTSLEGVYYPGATNPSPLVVMIHWVNGDMHDWNEVAVWLQNRGVKNPFPNPGSFPWWNPTWFPKLTSDQSYGVFIFSFRGCKPMNEKGCASWDIPGWVSDVQGAMLTAHSLEGVDTTRIVTIGSSIGADGAAIGCLYLNEQYPGSCAGVLSLSPGSYLVQEYPDVIEKLGKLQPSVAAWCVADSNEVGMCKMAITDDNTLFQYFEIPNGDHGNMLLRPDLEPLPMQLILDFLAQTTK